MKTIKFLILLLAITAIVSCQKENTDPTYHSDPSAVKLTAAVGSPFTRSNPLGEGAASAGFNAGDRIAVTAQGQEEIIYTLGSDGNWTPEAGKYHKWITETMSFTAYYPARYTATIDGDNNASLTTFNLPRYQNGRATGGDTDIARADYMTFSGNLTKGTNGAASIALERQMARIRVVVASVGNEIDVNNAVFDIDIFTQHTAIPANNGYHIVYPANSSRVLVGDVSTGLIIPGGALNNRSFIHVKVYPHGQSGDLSVYYFLNTTGIPALDAGKSYTYNVKVGKTKIEITDITVEDWTTGTPIPGGEAVPTVEINPDTHTLNVVVTGKLKSKNITDALDGGTELNMAGMLSDADIATIAAYSPSITVLNLVKADLSTVTGVDFTTQTSLDKVLCTESQATSSAVTWTFAAGTKHLYTGKSYGNYTTPIGGQSLPCYVLSVAEHGGAYKLVYGAPTKMDWQTANTYCQNLGGHMLSGDSEADFICRTPAFLTVFYEINESYWTDKFWINYDGIDHYITLFCTLDKNSPKIMQSDSKPVTNEFKVLVVFDIND